MGDLIPEGEINRATKAGQFFGYPWRQGHTRITEFGYDKDPLPPNITDPQVYMDAHAADLGLAFYSGKAFPAKYQGGLFSAQHGSWNRTNPIGARIMFTSLKADGTRRQDRGLCRGLARRGHRPVPRPPGRRGNDERRLDADQRRLRGCAVPRELHRAVRLGPGRAWLLLIAAAAAPSLAADAVAGRQKALACAVCHGPMGLAVALDAPHLAGQSAQYLGAATARLPQRRAQARGHECDGQTAQRCRYRRLGGLVLLAPGLGSARALIPRRRSASARATRWLIPALSASAWRNAAKRKSAARPGMSRSMLRA